MIDEYYNFYSMMGEYQNTMDEDQNMKDDDREEG
jgi:hypothetical protein